MVTWLFPGLVYATAAAAAPIVIHLLLRPRPRVQVFPALRLLRASHLTHVRRHRLQHLLLLIVRTLLIALIVLAAARPVWRGAWFIGGDRRPCAVVLCLDDSASMTYRVAERTYLQRAVEWGDALLFDETRFPAGSQFAVLAGSRPQEVSFTFERSAASRVLHSAPAGPHDRGVLGMISAAQKALRDLPPSPKEIYVLSDMAANAWAAGASPVVQPSTPTIIPVYILDAGSAERHNAGIARLGPEGPGPRSTGLEIPPNIPTTIKARISTGEDATDGQVELWLDGNLAARSAPFHANPDASIEVAVTASPMASGLHRGELRLDRADRNPDDDAAYFAVEVSPRLKIAVVSPTDDPLPHEEARRVGAMLAPPSMPEDRRPFDVTLAPPSVIDGAEFGEYGFAVWVEPAQPSAERVDRIRTWCAPGRTLLILTGPEMLKSSWKGEAGRLGAVPRGIVDAGQMVTIRDLSAAPRTNDPADLNGRGVNRYVRIDPSASAQVTATFANGDPAMIEEKSGAGRIVWWAFSMRADWSDLGVRAAPILVRLHRLAGRSMDATPHIANVYCDEAVELYVAAEPHPAMVRIERIAPALTHDRPIQAPVDASGRFSAWTGAAGLYRVVDAVSASGATALASYAVNIRSSETDGRRVTDDAAEAAMGTSASGVYHSPEELNRPLRAAAGDRSLDRYFWTAVLVLIALELLLTRRAYR